MPTLYTHVAVVECAEERALDELLASGLQRFIVRPLGRNAVQVDHERLAEIRTLFQHLGQTPRITQE